MGQSSDRSDSKGDRRLEAALLLHLVVLHPMRLTLDEVTDQLCTEGADGSAADRVRFTVTRLVEDGLLERRDSLVMPTRAALRSYELWEC